MKLLDGILDVMGSDRYRPRSACLLNDQTIMILYVAGDLALFVSLVSMGVVLFRYRARRVQMSSVTRALLGVFLFLCGVSYLSKMLTLFLPLYRLDVILMAAIAAVAATTAVLSTRELTGIVRT